MPARSTVHRALRRACACALATAGCAGPASSLVPAGSGAERIADLLAWMTGGAAVLWLGFVAPTLWAMRTRARPRGAPLTRWLVIGGGLVLPIALLTALLVYGLALLNPLLAAGGDRSLAIAVVGEQYWWRVRYELGDGRTVELANELHLPLDRPAELRLDSHDVIHSLWIPALAGKVDLIPGRTNRMVLAPTRTGSFRGLCAEYCGSSHAWMAVTVVVEEPAAFEAWLAAQAEPAMPPVDAQARRGRAAFERSGCVACHTVRGTAADGVIGPDLTHVGSRARIAAGRLPSEPAGFHAWVGAPTQHKPGATMPAFDMLADGELQAIAIYLEGLQ